MTMFNKILIANRGEIACRVIKTAQRLGVKTVAVYSDADRDALHTSLADEAIHIGPAPARDSYLCGDKIIAAARQTGAEAIHPGYGFLSENSGFALDCEKAGICFIGPPPAAIDAMGSKSAAKRIMESAGVPLVPGYHDEDQSDDVLAAAAREMGFPVLLKATAGGGGKGMRQVWSDDEFSAALDAARREASSSFGDDRMLVEKYLVGPRHVEIQVFCDSLGNAVYLAERDCSVQRRHQKVIEEAPAPGVDQALRKRMGEAAIAAARAIDYEGAGTVEFLLDSDGVFYFMEMNTRLQVEHPVTEMITGVDLVEWQLRVATGEPLPLEQDAIQITGHAFEARIYAEDPDRDFMPETGSLHHLVPPAESRHVRVDTGVRRGDVVSVHYDPMIAKLITWDESRSSALARLRDALRQYEIAGVTTNVEFLYNLSSTDAFAGAELDTGFIERHREQIFHQSDADLSRVLPLAALYSMLAGERKSQIAQQSSADRWSPFGISSNWRLNSVGERVISIEYQGVEYGISITVDSAGAYRLQHAENNWICSGQLDADELTATIDGHRHRVSVAEQDDSYSLYTADFACHFRFPEPDLGVDEDVSVGSDFTAPMNGTIVALLVETGAPVTAGDALLVMEAMKMEQTISAHREGKVTQFLFQPGDLVDGGAPLLKFEVLEEF